MANSVFERHGSRFVTGLAMVSPENVGYLCTAPENPKYLVLQTRERSLTGRNTATVYDG